jgi:hypothetical protein
MSVYKETKKDQWNLIQKRDKIKNQRNNDNKKPIEKTAITNFEKRIASYKKTRQAGDAMSWVITCNV